MKLSHITALLISIVFTLTQFANASVCVTNSTAWYTFPNMSNISLVNFFKYPNCAVGASVNGLAYIIIVLVLYAIMIVSMGDYEILARVAVASFTFSILASILSILGLFDIYLPVFFGLMTAISAALLYFSTHT